MSINWVMLNPNSASGFMLLPNEQSLWTSPPRTAIQLQSLNRYPGREPFQLASSAGRVHLTNQRVVYLPEPSTEAFQSFAAPLLRMNDSRITSPFIGPNAWVALVQPVPGGNIPSQHLAIEAKMTFKEGGAYDFHTKFTQLQERLRQAAQVAAESGASVNNAHAGRVDMSTVHLEQLPAYEERAIAKPAAEVSPSSNSPCQGSASDSAAQARPPAPAEPPPGYDEVQREVVAERLGHHEG